LGALLPTVVGGLVLWYYGWRPPTEPRSEDADYLTVVQTHQPRQRQTAPSDKGTHHSTRGPKCWWSVAKSHGTLVGTLRGVRQRAPTTIRTDPVRVRVRVRVRLLGVGYRI
jgi:hypothetical protein